MDLVLVCHSAILRRNGQAEGVTTLGLLFLVGPTDVPPVVRLPDLLLEQLLVLFVLLGILL